MASHIVAAPHRARPSRVQATARRLSNEVTGLDTPSAVTTVETCLTVLADPAPFDALLMRFVRKHQPSWSASQQRRWVEETLAMTREAPAKH